MTFEFEPVDDVNTVPEEYRGLYAKGSDGKFSVMDVARPLAAAYIGQTRALDENTGKLKNVNKESADRRVAIKNVAETFKKFGFEIPEDKPLHEVIEAYVTDLSDKVKNGQENKINVEKIQKDANTRIEQAVKSKDEEIQRKDRALSKYLIEQEATRAITESKGSVELLAPHIRSSVKVVAEGDDYVVRVVDESGDVRMNGKGGYMNVTDLVAEMKTKPAFARAFESETPKGSGFSPTARKTPPVQNNEKDMNPAQKIAAGLGKR